ncbi:MAG: HIT family protein [Steroidobacteraceae bacterium]|nr:HIT family protein [Steroidobacteraceae bacterium]
MDTARWEDLVRGINCPYDAPRAESNDYWDLVAALKVSSLYLIKNQTYRGQCVLIFDRRHAVRPEQLSEHEWTAFCADLLRAERAVMGAVKPDHMNLASLGNIIPHLHWHVVPRYTSDPRWGAPIWPTSLADMPDARLDVRERTELIGRLRDGLDV